MTTNNSGSNDTQLPVSFVVTGFGPFRDALQNPTTVVVNRLVEYLKNNNQDESLALRTTTKIIETSAQAARAELDTLMLQQQQQSSHTVYLHLGVNYKGRKFQLEQCAYNDATFRIPDEQGYQPRNKCIVDENALASTLTTTLDLETICTELDNTCTTMSSASPSPVIVLSSDPGRFVCNYTYYYSLSKSTQQCNPNVHSLFVHVPPFAVIPEEEQMKVVVAIMTCIDNQLAADKWLKGV